MPMPMQQPVFAPVPATNNNGCSTALVVVGIILGVIVLVIIIIAIVVTKADNTTDYNSGRSLPASVLRLDQLPPAGDGLL
jgi:serine/threonine-protein kinase